MIDLIVHAANEATLRTFAQNRGLLVNGHLRKGVDYCLWNGDGRFRTQVSPATYMTGVVALLRIYTDDDTINEGSEQWHRSQIAKYIKDNGTPGTISGIPYYGIDSVRLFRAADVTAWLTSRGLPGHEWSGGNSL